MIDTYTSHTQVQNRFEFTANHCCLVFPIVVTKTMNWTVSYKPETMFAT